MLLPRNRLFVGFGAICASLTLHSACGSTSVDRDAADESQRDGGTIDAGSSPRTDGGSIDAGSIDGGIEPQQPDPEYWGLANKNCFRYDDGSGDNYFTLTVTEDPNTVAGVKTFRLAFRERGWLKREEWVEVKGDGLVLWRRSEPGDQFVTPPIPPTFAIFDAPAPVYLSKGMRLQEPTISTTTATVSSGSSSEKVAMTVTVTKESNETIPALDAQQQSSKVLLSATRTNDGAGLADRLWFVPSLGFVKYELDGTGTEVVLKKIDRNVNPADCTP